MINLKFSGILGCAGFVLSLAVGAISGAGFPLVLIRAGIFAAAFFALGCGLWLLLNNFVPELIAPDGLGAGEPGDTLGTRVNITLGDSGVLPEMYRNMGGGDEVGNIGDLVSGAFKPPPAPPQAGEKQGLDQNGEGGYTESGNMGGLPSNDSLPSSDGLPSGGGLPSADGLGGMPDLDSMSGSFLDGAEEAPLAAAADESFERTVAPPERAPVGNKPHKMDGDFNPKDLAMGIRTVLSKED